MKHFVVDFRSISFSRFKAHGGGDFALRLIEYMRDAGIRFSIINNSTQFFREYSVEGINDNFLEKFAGDVFYYFNPLYVGGDNNLLNYAKKFVYIHGLRMLEMPYDDSSYLYERFPGNATTYIKSKFFRRYYRRQAVGLVKGVKKIQGDVEILTPSEHTKYMILSLGFSDISVEILPPFLNKAVLSDDAPLPTESPYILLLNADRWVKNSYRFLEAFTELKMQNQLNGLKLVLVGVPKFYRKFPIDTLFLDYVERSYLETLIKNCAFLAYPSLNEGFGYPPFDAFKYNKPVLSSSVSSPNILYNGKVIFANPFSVEEIKSRILYILDQPVHVDTVNWFSDMDNFIMARWAKVFC